MISGWRVVRLRLVFAAAGGFRPQAAAIRLAKLIEAWDLLRSSATIATMQPGAVLVDVSIDQGGCAETSRPTTHSQPTYIVHGVVHYCVANMPGAVPRTSTFALNNAPRPFILALADKGFPRALADDMHLRSGLNVHQGKITFPAVAEAHRLPFTPAAEVLRG